MYNFDHNIPFRKYSGYFEYVFNGETHRYYPDFELPDGTIVEIKGFDSPVWQAKLKQFPADKTLHVIDAEEIRPYLDYAIATYGKNFIS